MILFAFLIDINCIFHLKLNGSMCQITVGMKALCMNVCHYYMSSDQALTYLNQLCLI